MIDGTTRIIGCSLNVIISLDKQYKFFSKKGVLYAVIEGVRLRIEECSFMPDDSFIRFKSMEDFDKWKFKKQALSMLSVTGKLTTGQIHDR